LGLGVERRDEGEGEPATSGPGQLGMKLALAEADGCNLVQTRMGNSQC